jgi:hypothetical protein
VWVALDFLHIGLTQEPDLQARSICQHAT